MVLFLVKLLFDTSIGEESNLRVLLRFSNVRLLYALLREPLSQDVRHGLRKEGNRERELCVVT